VLNTAFGVLMAVIIVVCGLSISGKVGFERILSGSMAPTLNVGDVLVTKPIPASDIKVGMIVVFKAPLPGQPTYTHRVYRVIAGVGFQTKGDANNAPDPWTIAFKGSKFATPIFEVRYVGGAVGFLTAPGGRLVDLGILLTLTMVAGFGVLFPGRDKDKDKEEVQASQEDGGEKDLRLLFTPRRVLIAAGALVAVGVLAGAAVTLVYGRSGPATGGAVADSAILPVGSAGPTTPYNVVAPASAGSVQTLVTLDNMTAATIKNMVLTVRAPTGLSGATGVRQLSITSCSQPWRVAKSTSFRCTGKLVVDYTTAHFSGVAVPPHNGLALGVAAIKYLDVSIKGARALPMLNLGFTESLG
jgi:signal peptidase